jgi:hypothetical protein
MTGRIVFVKQATLRKIPVGQYLVTPGVYFYTVPDAATGHRYTGRVILR